MPKLSIVLPVYNEVATIDDIINQIQAVALEGIEKEIILVDDCSEDGTREKIGKYDGVENIKILYHEKNMGKGAALRSGFKLVSGDYVIIQDADLEYDPKEYNKLIALLIANKADVVFGSRFMGNEPHRVIFFWHFVGNTILTLLSNMFTNLNLTDMETCYKAFRAEILNRIQFQENGFGFEPEFTAKVARQRLRIYEIGVSYSGRSYAEGKKIVWKDGISALWCIIKYNLFRANK